MAATFGFSESNGVGESVTDALSNINFGSTDAPNLNTTTYPITYNTNSYSKYIRAKFTGTWTVISNMKFWKSAGAMGTGETIKASANATYATPATSSTGDSDIPTSVGASLSVNSFEDQSTIVYGASGVSGYSDYIRLQMQTTTGTPSGAVAQKTLILQYDEV